MLIDSLNEQKIGFVYPDGTSADRVLDPLRKRAAESQVFVLDRDAVAMAAHVSLSRPTSIVKALPWVKLPFQRTWLEFANADLRDAMAEFGSPNLKPAEAISVIKRSAFLMTQHGDEIEVEYIHQDVIKGEKKEIIDLGPAILNFQVGGELKPFDTSILSGRSDSASVGAKGKVKQHLDLLTNDPAEMEANIDIYNRIDYGFHPDMEAVRRNIVSMMGAEKCESIVKNQGDEARRIFLMLVLPSLILLNCRNAIKTEFVPAPFKLNKQRRVNGKPPIVEHRLVKIHLTAARQRRAAQHGDGGRIIRSALVSGHFKTRKTGVFWWSEHARMGYGKTPTQRRTIITH